MELLQFCFASLNVVSVSYISISVIYNDRYCRKLNRCTCGYVHVLIFCGFELVICQHHALLWKQKPCLASLSKQSNRSLMKWHGVVVMNIKHADINHPFFSTPLWLRMCYGLNSPSCLVLRTSDMFVFLPTFDKSTPPYMCCCTGSGSFHFAILFVPFSFVGFAIVLSWGRAVSLNLNAKIKAWVEEGNFCISCKLRKGKSHPVFM